VKPRGLDVFSGAGGCTKGYTDAGFGMEGVDNEPHPDYPGVFHLADAIDVLEELAATGEVFGGYRPELVHTSPPCHDWSDLSAQSGLDGSGRLLFQTRDLLERWADRWGGFYVIENVEGAPLQNPITLCGSEFGLGARCRDGKWRQLRRHRLFESNVFLMGAGGCHHSGQPVGVYGTGGGGQMTRGYKAHPEEAREAMQIDWMARDDICQAIPPVYCEFIGEQIMAELVERAA
jgi:DNA (cytosine-5)-methyltransferase 1